MLATWTKKDELAGMFVCTQSEQMGIHFSWGMRKDSILIYFFKYYQSNEIFVV